MAKSIRSKWRRKCRAVKRERYGAKELARLKVTLGITDAEGNVNMQEVSEVATVTDAKSISDSKPNDTKDKSVSTPSPSKNGNTTEETSDPAEVEAMDDGSAKVKRIFNKKTMRDQFGNYPVWMNQRRVKKQRGKKAKGRRKRPF